MYSQSLFGPRWFLPVRFRGIIFNFYKSRDEIIYTRPDADNVTKI